MTTPKVMKIEADGTTPIDELAEILCNEVDLHDEMAVGEKLCAAMLLIARLVASVDCPDNLAKWVVGELPDTIKQTLAN